MRSNETTQRSADFDICKRFSFLDDKRVQPPTALTTVGAVRLVDVFLIRCRCQPFDHVVTFFLRVRFFRAAATFSFDNDLRM